MKHVKQIKDERGKTNIYVTLHTFPNGGELRGLMFRYDITVGNVPPKKRNERYGYYDLATKEEILQAKTELWELLKPKP